MDAAELDRRIARLRTDRTSGATAILHAALDILRDAREAGLEPAPVARAICQAQPAMAPVWNAGIEAVAAQWEPDRLERFAERVRRAGRALERFAVALFALDRSDAPLRLVTLSRSRSVEGVIEALRRTRPLHVSCSESRPGLEGRHLAAHLAAAGIPVTTFSDAAIGHALAGADAVLLGADAVSDRWFLNKSGSRMLAAAAAGEGVPVYVAATRDKFAGPTLSARLTMRDGASAEIWEGPPPGIEVRNPYFERVPVDLAAGVITDMGVLGAATLDEVCRSLEDPLARRAVAEIGV